MPQHNPVSLIAAKDYKPAECDAALIYSRKNGYLIGTFYPNDGAGEWSIDNHYGIDIRQHFDLDLVGFLPLIPPAEAPITRTEVASGRHPAKPEEPGPIFRRTTFVPAFLAPDLARNMNEIVNAAHAASSAAGWWIDPETGKDLSELRFFPYVVGTKLMLMVSEIAEGMEGHRKGLNDDKLPHRTMIEVELADAVLRIADLAGKLGCDLGGALVEKMAFNAVRPDHKPGARMSAGGKAY